MHIEYKFLTLSAGDQTRWIIDSWSFTKWYKQGIWVLERTKLREGSYQVLISPNIPIFGLYFSPSTTIV